MNIQIYILHISFYYRNQRLQVKEMVSREYKRRAYSIIWNPGRLVKSGGHCSQCIVYMNTSIINPPNNSDSENQRTVTVLSIPILQARGLKLRQAGEGARGHLQSGGCDRPWDARAQALHSPSHCLLSTWQPRGREDPVQPTLQIPRFTLAIPERLVS